MATTDNTINQSASGTVGNTVNVGGVQTPVAITPEQLAPATPINMPQPPPVDNSTPDGLVSGAKTTSKAVDQTIADLTPTSTAADQQQQQILDSIASLTGQDANKGQDQVNAETTAGIPGMQTNLQNLQNELDASTAAYDKKYANAEIGIGQTTSDVLGQQGAIRKSEAADIGVTQAKISATQGNLTLAQNQVNRAIDLKYSTIEGQINVKKAQLDALMPTLNKEDKLTALAQQKVLNDQAQAVADKKAQDLQIQNMALDAIKSGADAQTVQKIGQSTSLEQATTIATQYADQAANLKTAQNAKVTTPAVNEGGKFYDAKTGKVYATPQDFFKAMGVKDFAEAYAKKLVTDINPMNFNKTGVASYDEWQLYKANGGTLNYNDYQTMDINRKARVGGITTTVPVTESSSKATQYLNLYKGSDGKVSPETWNTALTAWLNDNHSTSDFVARFEGMINKQDPGWSANYNGVSAK